MASEFEPMQRVQIVRERGTREVAFVRGVFKDGKVLVEREENFEVELVDREDIET